MSTPAENLHMDLPSDQNSSGRTLGEEEIAAVAEAIRSGTLTSTKGQFTKRLESTFAEMIGSKHCYAANSGTGALHCAFAAIDPEPGDEIVTTSITDIGGLTPIIYQSAIPVFADVDPDTCNVTAETIEKVLSDRTRAIVVTHLFGNPCDMGPIMELARSRNIPVIEDCAQSFLAPYDGRKTGTIGDIGCFSLQQGKHITTGEGGLVVSDNDELARRMYLFINKAWGYGDPNPDHYFLAINYRMTELQGAVAVAQLDKLGDSVSSRQTTAAMLSERLDGLTGVQVPKIHPKADHVWWKYTLHVDLDVIPGGAVEFGKALQARGIVCAPRYIQKPAFRCQVIRDQRTFGNSRFPFNLARPEAVDYDPFRFQGTFEGLERIVVLPWNENYTEEHVNYIANAVTEVAHLLRGRG